MPKPQRDPHAPKRAQSSYLLYQNAYRDKFKAEVSDGRTIFVFDAMMCSFILCSNNLFPLNLHLSILES